MLVVVFLCLLCYVALIVVCGICRFLCWLFDICVVPRTWFLGRRREGLEGSEGTVEEFGSWWLVMQNRDSSSPCTIHLAGGIGMMCRYQQKTNDLWKSPHEVCDDAKDPSQLVHDIEPLKS